MTSKKCALGKKPQVGMINLEGDEGVLFNKENAIFFQNALIEAADELESSEVKKSYNCKKNPGSGQGFSRFAQMKRLAEKLRISAGVE